MEHEGEVYRRCRFEGRLSDDEATILTYLESAVQQCETNEIALPASLTVVKDGQATLTPVSKEQAVWLMEKFELVATKSAEAGESAARQTCPAFRLAVRFASRAFGFRHAVSVELVNWLACCLEQAEQLNEALALYRFVLEFNENTLGSDHRNTAFGIANVADCLTGLGRYREALPLRRRELELLGALSDDDGSLAEMALFDIAACLSELDRIDEEIRVREELLERRRSRLDDCDVGTLDALYNLGACHLRAGSSEKALALFEREAQGWAARPESSGDKILKSNVAAAICLMNLRRFSEAEPKLAKVLAAAHSAGLEDDPIAKQAKELQAECLSQCSEWRQVGEQTLDTTAYSNCVQLYTRREFDNFLDCALPMINGSHFTLIMIQAILISAQRLGRKPLLKSIVPQLFSTMRDPWERSLIALTLGLQTSDAVLMAADDSAKAAQAYYYSGCRLLTLGKVGEARGEFEKAKSQDANNEEWLFSLFELGHPDLSIGICENAVSLVGGAMWQEYYSASTAGGTTPSSQVPDPPFTVTEITDQLVKDRIPRVQWERVVDELNASGKASVKANEFRGNPLENEKTIKYFLQRIETLAGLIYMSNFELSAEQFGSRQPSESASERVYSAADGLPGSDPSGLVADDRLAWVSYPKGGLYCIDATAGTVDRLSAKGGHEHDQITSLHLSRRFLWVGSAMGLSRLDLEQGNWKMYEFDGGSVNAIVEDGNAVWALRDSSLVQLDWPQEELRAIHLPVTGEAKALAVVDREVWCGFDEERSSLLRFVVDDESWHRIDTRPYVLSLLHEPIWYGQRDLWVGTCMGVQLVDRVAGIAEDFGLANWGMIHSIGRIGGFITFGTKRGLFGIDLFKEIVNKERRIEELRFSGLHVTRLAGEKDNLWAAVSREGIAFLPVKMFR